MGSTTRKAWTECYQTLHRELMKLGTESPFGDGDFWLVDEDYGAFDQKICVFQAAFLNKVLIRSIQSVLVRDFQNWRVFIVLEIRRLLEVPHEEGGLIVTATKVEEHWEKSEIERILGEKLCYE